jgi:rubredoxin
MADEGNTPVVISREEAKAKGLKHYFTGRPCNGGHVSIRFVSTWQCRECLYEHRKKWRASHAEDERRQARSRHAANPEKERSKHRRWRQQNLEKARLKRRIRYHCKEREKARISNGRRYANDPDKYRAFARNSYHRNADRARLLARERYAERLADDPLDWRAKGRAAAKKWKSNNPDRITIIARNAKAKRKGAPGKHTADDLAAIFKAQRGRCAICRSKLGADRQVDHIVPLSKGGTNDRANLQWACATCNLEKRAHDPIEFMQSIGRLL